MATARVIDVSGAGWSIREALGNSWRWYVGGEPARASNNVADAAARAERTPGWLPARVPGSVIADLHAAGEIPDPYTARNSKAVEWVAARHWVYRRVVEVPAFDTDERVVLEFDGIDPGGAIFWDGVEVARAGGIFRSTRVQLDTTAGPHNLVVVVEPSPPSEPQVGRTERVRIHAPRMNYGWDFCPRLLHQGIWKAARIRIGRALLGAVSVRTELDADLSTGRVIVRAEVGSTVSALAQRVVVAEDDTPQPRPDGTDARRVVLRNGADQGSATIEVHSPELWHPVGRGAATLHSVRVSTADDEREFLVGFRRIEFVANPGSPAGALPYTAVVNGEPLPLVGWNWAPADPLYGTITRERIEYLVDLARRSGARILRVWGGGLIETEEFYDACDRAGLLVWQEFSQSSSGEQSAPAMDDEFVELMRSEARAIIPTRTHHPSFAIWGGGNELDDGGVPLDEQRSPVLAALRDVARELDPGRHSVATSPTGPQFHNRLDTIRAAPDDQHDVHGPWEHQGLVGQYELYNSGTSLAHTEFGVEGMTNLRSLDALVPVADRWPTDRSNPVYRHLGEWWNNAPFVSEAFGGRLDSVERMQRASQFLQATGLAYAVEADRRRAPRCSIVLPWQLAESYPNAWCTSVVDYRGDAKDAYFAVARAFLPNRVTIRTDRCAWGGLDTASAQAWVWSENGEAAASTVRLRALDPRGESLAEAEWSVADVGAPIAVGTLELQAPAGLFAWEATWVRDAAILDRDVVLATGGDHFGELLDPERATVSTQFAVHNSSNVSGELGNTGERARGAANGRCYAQGASLRVTHAEGPIVPGLRVLDARPASAEGWTVVSGDPRPLLPGESREFTIEWRDTEQGPVRLEAWNIDPVELRPSCSARAGRHRRDRLLDSALPGLGCLRVVDRVDVIALFRVRERGEGFERTGRLQRLFEIVGHLHRSRLVVEFDRHLDFVARHDPGRGTVGGAQREHEPVVAGCDTSAIRVVADGHDHGWVAARAEVRDRIIRNRNAGCIHALGLQNFRTKCHGHSFTIRFRRRDVASSASSHQESSAGSGDIWRGCHGFARRSLPATAVVAGSSPMVMITLPRLRPVSTYSWASAARSIGYSRSITGTKWPATANSVMCARSFAISAAGRNPVNAMPAFLRLHLVVSICTRMPMPGTVVR